MTAYYLEGINSHAGPPCARFSEKPVQDIQNPADAAYPLKRRFTFDPSEGSDGLDAARGLCSALIIEILAGGLLWAGWYFAPRIAAWWRTW